MPSLAISCTGNAVMSRSPSNTRPPSGRTTPLTALKSVVLPQPFGPIRPRLAPGASDRSTGPSASTPPKRTVKPSSCNSIEEPLAETGQAIDGALVEQAARPHDQQHDDQPAE